MSRGRFITLEGPEGSGKSTQARNLASRIGAAGIAVLVTREPGGTPLGEAVRGILQHDTVGGCIVPEAELLLFEASRAQLARTVIAPALEEGTWVLCDRFADSTTAYQGYGRGFDIETVLTINGFAVGGVQPDLTLLLDIDVSRGFERLHERNRQRGLQRDRIERESLAFHEAVRRGYLALAQRWPDRFCVVSTDREERAVHEDIWQAVRRRLMDGADLPGEDRA
jgi:dTMP kinase